MEEPRTFGWALKQMHGGSKICRKSWNHSQWVPTHLALQVPDANSKMTLPYIYMLTPQGDLAPWLPSQADVLATDWSIAQ